MSRTRPKHSIRINTSHAIHSWDGSTFDRFRDMKEECRSRNDLTELRHEEFLSILMDVYELHLEDDRGKETGVTRGP